MSPGGALWLRLGQPHPRHQGEIIVATSLYSICEKKNSNINMNVTTFISSSKLALVKILTLLQGGQPGHAHRQGGHGGGKGGKGGKGGVVGRLVVEWLQPLARCCVETAS